jgi:hypothetical protein
MPTYHSINSLEDCNLRRSIIGIDGIYNDEEGGLSPSKQSLISNSYFERERLRSAQISPSLGNFDDSDSFAEPPPQPERMFTQTETPIDVFSLSPSPPILSDATKILLTLMLFIIGSCFFHSFVLWRDRNKEWAFYLQTAVGSTIMFIMVLWAMDITISNIYT